MREIVFRGKRIDNGKWIYGDLRQYSKKHIGIYSFELQQIVRGIDPSTVGQYTGLKDKNGRRIFEGDIVKAQDDLIFSPFCDGLVGKVVYIETAFFIEPKDPAKTEYLFNECAVYEVLGNIHDNPELMEVR